MMRIYAIDRAQHLITLAPVDGSFTARANAHGHFKFTFALSDSLQRIVAHFNHFLYLISVGSAYFWGVPTELTLEDSVKGQSATIGGISPIGVLAYRVCDKNGVFEGNADDLIKNLAESGMRDGEKWANIKTVILPETSRAPEIKIDVSWRDSIYDAMLDVVDSVSGLYFYELFSTKETILATSYRRAADARIKCVLTTVDGSASQITYTTTTENEINVVYGVGRKTDRHTALETGPIESGALIYPEITRREAYYNNASIETLEELTSNAMNTLTPPQKTIMARINGNKYMTCGDVVAIDVAGIRVVAIITAVTINLYGEAEYAFEVLE